MNDQPTEAYLVMAAAAVAAMHHLGYSYVTNRHAIPPGRWERLPPFPEPKVPEFEIIYDGAGGAQVKVAGRCWVLSDSLTVAEVCDILVPQLLHAVARAQAT